MTISKWLQFSDQCPMLICWSAGDEALVADLSLVPELISALMLMIEDAAEVTGTGGVLVDLEIFTDVQRLLDEMHVQYREEEG